MELHTDLSASDARALLRRSDSTLRTIARYWRRPLERRIVLYVVDDLTNWPQGSLPHPQARIVLRHVRGATQFPISNSDNSETEAHIYATSERGIAEHEMVHAYCWLTFGGCGPDWYKEGMADMAFHYSDGAQSVRCTIEVARQLRDGHRGSVQEIVESGDFTRPIAELFVSTASPETMPAAGMLDWQNANDELVRQAKKHYHRSWALCYFLSNSPNYQRRFRELGIGYLYQSGVDFHQLFSPVADRLTFEFELFLRDIDQGYRVDLCHWDWDAEFSTISGTETKESRVLAARGYQPSGLQVTEGQTYHYTAEGRWLTCPKRPAETADGSYFGQGGLEGVIYADYSLGTTFDLGTRGSFVADRTGKLFLRCRDEWHLIADNEGGVAVQLSTDSRIDP